MELFQPGGGTDFITSVSDTDSVNLRVSGGGDLTANVNISSAGGNIISINADGLFAGIVTPDTFDFTDKTGVALNTLTQSNTITLSGAVSTVWPIVINGQGSPLMSINGGSYVSFANVQAGDTIQLELTSSSSATTDRVATLQGTGFSADWSVTTLTLDPDAVAFLVAAGIMDTTITNAVNTLVLSLKSNSLWTKFYAIYPIVGGTATSHKYNLVNPADTDGAYRLTFSGTITHTATGMTGNGSSGYATTHFNPNTVLSANSGSLLLYSRTNNTTGLDFGCINGAGKRFLLAVDFGGTGYSQITQADNLATVAVADSKGFFVASRISSTDQSLYRNGSSIASETSADNVTVWPNFDVYFIARNSAGVVDQYTTREYAFAGIASALTSGENATLYTIVQQFETDLSRNV